MSLEPAPLKGSIARHARLARRVRITLDGLEGNASLARKLEHDLGQAPWIADARADEISGRLLIQYGPQTTFTPELLRELALDVGWAGVPAPAQGEPATATIAEKLGQLKAIAAARADHAVGLVQRFSRAVGRTLKSAGVSAMPDAHGAPDQAANNEETSNWHSRAVAAVLTTLETSARGLSGQNAAERIVRYGANVTETERARTRAELIARQFANLPTVLLLGSAGVSLLLGDFVDAGVIVVVVGVNAAIGYRIERRNDRLLASWRRLEAGEAQALRDEDVTAVGAADLVPGDVILLRAGDVIPADARVLDAHRLACDEAALTGESEAQNKSSDAVAAAAPLAERHSMVYAGTMVVSGRGRAVVVATGQCRQMSMVRRLVEETADPEAPLQKRMDALGRRATLVGLAAGGIVLVGSLLRGRGLAVGLRGAVALAVAAIPEGMPVVATAALVTAMERMRKQGMVVRRVVAAETLGGVTVVCVDKTGTLTENEMRVEAFHIDGDIVVGGQARPDAVFEDRATLAMTAGVLNSDIEYHHNNHQQLEVAGSSTERALVKFAQQAGLDPDDLRRRFPRRQLRERTGGIHYVVSIHDTPSGQVAFVKGAPEQVVALCERDADGPLDDARRKQLLERNELMAFDGQRVLALGWARVDEASGEPTSFDLLGLVGLRDPVRDGAAEAVATAARAGIRTIILTGDQRATAAAIGRAVGLPGVAVDGAELAARLEAGDPSAEAELDGVSVLSRVAPEHKLAIVRALRRRGEIVAMAGDGINDAPALKLADVGIAVGANASDIARQTADVVLENADLRAILAAVGEGRIVQDNLRRSIRFLFASNLSEVLVSLGGLAAATEPLSSLQLLWINLLTDTLPGLALALEPGDPLVLARKPAPPDAPLLSPGDWRVVARDGALLGALGALGFAVGGSLGAFSVMTAAQLSYAFTCRSDETPMEPRFVRLVGGAVALQAAALLFPPLRALLRLPAAAALSPIGLGGMVAGLGAPLAVQTIVRGIKRTGSAKAALETGEHCELEKGLKS